METYLDVLFDPSDVLPLRYKRKQPVAESNAPDPKVETAVEAVKSHANQLWADFVTAVAELIRPFPDLLTPFAAIANDIETRLHTDPDARGPT